MSLDTQAALISLPENVQDLIPSRLLPKYIGISAQTLARWRHQGKGPKYLKAGKKVFYRVASIHEWLAAQERSRTIL